MRILNTASSSVTEENPRGVLERIAALENTVAAIQENIEHLRREMAKFNSGDHVAMSLAMERLEKRIELISKGTPQPGAWPAPESAPEPAPIVEVAAEVKEKQLEPAPAKVIEEEAPIEPEPRLSVLGALQEPAPKKGWLVRMWRYLNQPAFD